MEEPSTPTTFLTTAMEPRGEDRVTLVLIIPFLSAVCILGLVGNLFVLTVYTRKKYRRSNAAMYMYIMNLALGDMVAIVVVLFHITEFFQVTWPILWRTDVQCALHRYFRFVAFDVTVFTMVAIAIDRYFAVVHPLKFRLKFSIRRTKIICVSLWVLSLVAAVPTTFMFKAIYNNDTMSTVVTYSGKIPFACAVVTPFGPWWPEFKSVYLNILLFYLPAFITAAIYIVIVVKIRRRNRPQHTTGPTGAKSGAELRSRKSWKSARSLLMVFVAYVLCYGSFATYNVLSKYTTPGLIPAAVYNTCLLLPYANSCMNPIIYSFANPRFREACREVVCRRRRKRSLPKDCRDATTQGTPVVLKNIAFISGSFLRSDERSNRGVCMDDVIVKIADKKPGGTPVLTCADGGVHTVDGSDKRTVPTNHSDINTASEK